ncbi:hypothetical protein [uncultured Pedobacter sp.]|uniref:hypothetical protein n=1 Tax=uncultured Pedobacter sp. TaxID=246139 RepID=UPI0025CD7090|nr:hypothetical protein [uncultured Pedobacter sp.]
MDTIYKRFTFNSYYLLILCVVIIFGACKKQYEDYPYADILSFTIKDAQGNLLKAVVDGQNLIIYWPSGQEVPDHIVPAIVVSEKATVSPASGQRIAFNEGAKFVVTAQNGTSKEYLIKKIINQPLLKINISSGVLVYNNKSFVNRGSNINVTGDNILAGKDQTSAFLVNTANSTERKIAISSITPISLSALVDAAVPDGNYQLKIISGQRSVLFQRTFGVSNGRPAITPVELSTIKLTLKTGEEFVLSGENRIELVNQFAIRHVATKQMYNLIIKETKAGELTLKVPEDLPAGNYDLYSYNYPAGDYYPAGPVSGVFDDMITIVN